MLCQHQACACLIESNSYCSDHCGEWSLHEPDNVGEVCQCGHSDCPAVF